MSRVPSGQAPVAGVHLQAQFIHAVSCVHALVSEQAAPKLLYQAVLDGALRLLDGESGALRFVDQADPGWMVAVAFHSAVGTTDRARRRAPITEGLSGRVISTSKPVAVENQGPEDTGSRMAPPGTRAGIGVPICERGEVVGALTDPLTGLGNRTQLLDRLEHRLAALTAMAPTPPSSSWTSTASSSSTTPWVTSSATSS